MMSFLFSLFQWLLILAVAPAIVGCVRTIKARFQNRRGASIFQPYWALLSLCKKEMTVTKYRSWIFHVAPFAVLGSTLLLAFLVPTLGVGGWVSERMSSVFLIGAVLSIGSVFLVLGGMDVASAFGGMGSSREMTLAALVEPSIILFMATLGYMTDSWSLDGSLHTIWNQSWIGTHPFFIISLVGFVLVVLAENARYPVDNPATHLELTMVHEVMLLEYSGPYLAMMEYASSIKLTVLATFLLNLVWPHSIVFASSGMMAILFGVVLLVFKVGIAAFGIASIESLFAKMRFYRMQEYMATTFFLTFAGLVLMMLM